MTEKKKIMVLIPPATGHVNPICGLIHELCKNKNIEVIFYGDEQYRGIIEKTGAEFRLNEKSADAKLNPNQMSKKFQVGEILGKFVELANDQLPQYIADAEKEKPDLILYDGMSFSAKYLIEIIKTRNAKGDHSIPIPKFAAFAPNFPAGEKMMKIMRENNKESAFWSALSLVGVFRKQFALSCNFGISVYNPMRLLMENNDKLNIVAVNPELQPYREDFDDTYKFVGSCISEETRSVDFKDDPGLKALLDQFDQKQNDQKLIFMSLGSIFHFNNEVYEKAIIAFQKYDASGKHSLKSSQFRVILSVGEQSLKKITEKITNGALELPKYILLRPKVPQLEVLKRADLFITHCGMNSTLETIKYAVPVIGLPFSGDQPMNATRICDELQFGVRLDPSSFAPYHLADAIDKVLSNHKYKTNIENMSQISAKYNGAVEGSKILTDYLYQ